MLKLVMHGDREAAVEISVSTKPIILGRGEGSTVLLNDPSVSQNHAKIMMRQGKVYIRDMESTNGVLVNGEQISIEKSRVIIPGDRIDIGIYTFTLQDLEENNEMTKLSPIEADSEESELQTRIDMISGDQQISEDEKTAVNVQDVEAVEEETVLMSVDQPAKLVIIKGIEKNREYLLDKREMLIGRSEDNEIRLHDPKVSRGHHAKLTIHDDHTVTVEDLNSTNGIYIKGKRVATANVSKSKEIQIGETVLRYVASGENLDIDDIGKVQRIAPSYIARIPRPVLIAVPVLVVILMIISAVVERKEDSTETVKINMNESITSYLFNSSAYLEAGSWTRAVEELNKVISADPDNANAIELRAMAETEMVHKDHLESALAAVSEKKYDAALGMLERIPSTSFYFGRAVEETGRINGLIGSAKSNKKKKVPPKRKIYSIEDAIHMYAIGQSEKALSMLKSVGDDSENKKAAKTYSEFIIKAEQSFRTGTSMYNNNNIDGAVQEWKKTLVSEKELPLMRKSFYASQIAGAAADEFYKKGLAYYNNGDLPKAIDNWIKAVESSPEHKDAMSALERIAAQLYEEGNAAEGSNVDTALQKWNDVLYVVPKGSVYYNRALEKINQYSR